MDRSELEKLAERYQQKADRAFENYQDTGLRRYDTERNNMEDLADACGWQQMRQTNTLSTQICGDRLLSL